MILPARGMLAVLLLMVLMSGVFPATSAFAEEIKTVRVGWYESPFNITDQFGRRSGYAYEFQEKVAAYTDWQYAYVEGSWPELLQMLINGEIDLLSDVSYTKERTEYMLFPSYPMGAEEYYLFVSSANSDYTAGSYAWFDGKRVGVNQGSVQAGFFQEWQETYGVRSEVVELTGSVEEIYEMLREGEIDAWVSIDSNVDREAAVPVIKVGSSDFFFAVNKARPDLLEDLNGALSRIQDENRFYPQLLFTKYFSTIGANVFLTAEEKNWLDGHGTIRVGYQDDELPFCDADEKTGELTGALKDYLEHAADCLENAHLDFEAIAYPSASAAMEALKNGEVDCMFPSNLSISDGETMGFIMTPAIMSSEVFAVVPKADQNTFGQKEQVVTAVEAGDPNYVSVVMDHFPTWRMADYPAMKDCLWAVGTGQADCALISNYQYNNFEKLCEVYKLTPLTTGKEVNYYIAVNRGHKELYSILTRTTSIVSDTVVNAALTYYATEEARVTLLDLIVENPIIVAAAVVVLIAMLLVIFAQHRMIKAKREAEEQRKQVDALDKQVYVDALTHVRNKGAFVNMMEELQAQVNRKEDVAFAVGMLDCNDLKKVNDQYGHEKGDAYLKTACHLICTVFRHSPVFRVGGDEFAVILRNEDYEQREERIREFEEAQAKVCAEAKNPWEEAHIALGIAAYDPKTDRTANDTECRADQIMYANKRAQKKTKQAGR